jgi:hypothetical protein
MVRPRPDWRSDAGFSTHEILVAATVGLMIAAGFVSFNHYQIRAIHDQVSQLELQTMDRDVLDLFAREVRRAGTNPTCAAGITALSEAKTTGLRIQADLNGNGVIDATNNEDVIYRASADGEALERVTNNTVETLLSGVKLGGSSLRYYDGSGTELVPNPALTTAQAASVRRVRLELKVSNDGYTSYDSTMLSAAAATDIELRNRFFNASVTCQ